MSDPDLSRLRIERSSASAAGAPRQRGRRLVWAVVLVLLAGAVAFVLRARAPVAVETTAVALAYPSQNYTVLNATGYVVAQVGFPPAPPKVSPAAGVIDMHVHPDPDVFGRALTDVELAMVARRKGMRGIVLKNHVVTTADRAQLAMDAVPGIDIWGGIVLNNANGGINGRPVNYIVEDDAWSPEQAAQVGAKLVNDDQVVAMVGNTSFVECAANAKLYDDLCPPRAVAEATGQDGEINVRSGRACWVGPELATIGVSDCSRPL